MAVPEFGERESGRVYRERPGAYAVLRDAAGRIAVCVDDGRWFLPGGGVEPDEDVRSALAREVTEETGLALRVEAELGVAVQLLFAATENVHFRKVGHFFLARVDGRAAPPRAPEHEVQWVEPAEAAARLCEEFQRWAVGVALARWG